MFTTVTAQLSTDTLLRLIEHLRTRGGASDVSETLNTALAFWLDANDGAHASTEPSGVRGYQWKSLFLPEGTILRSWSYGEHNYARVEGDKIIHDGESVSPNQFARAFARTIRNAWFDLSVRRPGDRQFKMACVLRKELAAQERQRAQEPALISAASVASAGPATSPAPATAAAPAAAMPAGPAARAAPAAPAIGLAAHGAAGALKLSLASPAAAREPVKKSDFDPGWDLPERRKFRYRIEDIAY